MRLPIEGCRDQIVDTVLKNQITIVVGEPGSGKTTMLPYFLYKEGLSWTGRIGITQPRRIAAASVAQFLAKKLNVEVGTTVAHKVRFDDKTDPSTEIKFMPDGVLLRELRSESLLSKYSVVIVDEAHERTANLDFLLGLLKRATSMRKDLKLIVASATIDDRKFSEYFDNAPVITVGGRPHDVAIVWNDRDCVSPQEIKEAVLARLMAIRKNGEEGDVLIFLPAIDQINDLVSTIDEMELDDLMVVPAHGMLTADELERVFARYQDKRKVVIATNIAETSLTVEGMKYVIDSGQIRQSEYYPRSGVGSLDIIEHSQAGCDQRAGRVGRTTSGVCYRLFTEENFVKRPKFTETEMRRMSLAGIVLAMEALEISDIENFPFIDMPSKEAINDAYRTLTALGAVASDTGRITELGKEMDTLPLEPHIARMLLEAKRYDCVEDVATIAAFLSCFRSVWQRPQGMEEAADEHHRRFAHQHSDALTLLDIWERYEAVEGDGGWCRDNFLSVKVMKEAAQVRAQLIRYLLQLGTKVSRTNNKPLIRRAVAAGLIYHLLGHKNGHAYEGVFRSIPSVFIHPKSTLFGKLVTYRWLVAAEISSSTKLFARICTAVDPAWLPELAPEKFFLGQRSLKAPAVERGEWVVRRWVEYKNRKGLTVHGGETVTEHVTRQQAQKMQEDDICDAEKNGWVVLTIDTADDADVLIGVTADGRSHPIFDTLRIASEKGNRWYCMLDQSIFPEKIFARPQFRVHDFTEKVGLEH